MINTHSFPIRRGHFRDDRRRYIRENVSPQNISATIIVIKQINIVISEIYDFIDLTFDGSYDKMQLCHTASK